MRKFYYIRSLENVETTVGSRKGIAQDGNCGSGIAGIGKRNKQNKQYKNTIKSFEL